MVKGRPGLPLEDELRLFRRALDLEGVATGAEIPRRLMDDMVIAAFGISSRASISAKLRAGEAYRLWRVTEAHGKGGRGFVTLLDPQGVMKRPSEADAAVIDGPAVTA